MEQDTVYRELCKTFTLLKDLRDSHKDIKESNARKYCYNYWVYVAEKMHAIECANLEQNSKCLDISTGVGLLPFILKNMGHACDATDIIDPLHDMDTDVQDNSVTQVNAFRVIRDVHNVSINELRIEKNKYINLPTQYDCIFSMRVVWDTGWGQTDDCYKFIINNLLDYSKKVVISWNIDDNIPQVLQPYVNQSQFEYGTLTIHTEKIK